MNNGCQLSVCQCFLNTKEGACRKRKMYQLMLKFIHDNLCRPNTPSSRNNMCWQEMFGGLAGHWATLGFSLFLLHFMSSSLPRPNIFLLLFSEKYLSFNPRQDLFTVVTEEGTLWASPLGGHPSLDTQTPCKWEAPGLALSLLTCSQLTSASYTLIIVVSV